MAIRPKPDLVRALLTALCALPALAQLQPDTLAFAQHIMRYRTPDRELTAAEVKSIQAEYLDWLDARVTAGISIEQMNIELNSGKLLGMTNTANMNELAKSHTGFVG